MKNASLSLSVLLGWCHWVGGALSAGQKCKALFGVLALGWLVAPLQAGVSTYVWNGGTGSWDTPGNWTPSGVPGTGATVTISSGSASVDSNVTVGSLILTNSGGITGAAKLSVENALFWKGGSMSGGGETIVLPGATAELGTVTLNGRIFNLQGTGTWTNSASWTFSGGGIFNVATNGVFNLHVAGSAMISGAGTINNFGVMTKTGTAAPTFSLTAFNNHGVFEVQAGNVTMAAAFNNNGTARSQAGLLFLNGGGAGSGGVFESVDPGQVVFGGGSHTLTNAQLMGSGTNLFSAGTLTVEGNVGVEHLSMSGGTLSGAGALFVTNTLIWSGGSMDGGGVTTVLPGAVLQMSGTGAKTLVNRTLNHGGLGAWTGTGSFFMTSGTFSVLGGGVWEIQNDALLQDSDGAGTPAVFNNFGTVKKTAGTNVTSISILAAFNNTGLLELQSGSLTVSSAFHNSGTARAQTGLLSLSGSSGISSGTFESTSNGSIRFSGGSHTLTNGVQLVGAGTNLLTGGIVNIAGSVGAERLQMSGGSLSGAGTLTVSNALYWSGGIMTGSGVTTVLPDAVLAVSGTAAKTVNGRTLNLGGTGTWTGTNTFGISSGSFNVLAGGVFDIQTDAAMPGSAGTNAGALSNFGLIRKATTGKTGIGVLNFTNAGTLHMEGGSISVTNNFRLSPTSTLNFVLGGTNAGVNYGRLELGNAVALQGTIQVDFTNSFTPATNDLFTLLTFPARSTNEFDIEVVPTNPLSVIYNANSVQLGGLAPYLNITQSPANATVAEGTNVVFTVGAEGSGTLAYQWRKNGTNMANGGRISGAQSPSLTLINVQADDRGNYDVVVSNADFVRTSSAATLALSNIRYIWTGGIGLWHTAANWTPVGVPGTGDTVTINSGTVSVNSDATVDEVTLTGGGIAGTGRLTAAKNMAWTGGALTGTGELAIPIAAKLQIGTVTLNGRTLNIMGTATWTNSTGFTFDSGRIDIAPGGVFDIRVGSVAMTDSNGPNTPSVFNNNGFFKKNSAGTTTVAITTFNNITSAAGDLNVLSGSLNVSTPFNNDRAMVLMQTATSLILNNGGVLGGEFRSLGNGKVTFNSGDYALTNGLRFTGTATNRIVGAALSVVGTVAANYLEMIGGEISGAGDLTVTNFFWTGGTMSGSGATTIPAGGVLKISGDTASKDLDGRTLNLGGTGTWTGAQNLSFQRGVFNVLTNGVWEIQTDAAMQDDDPTGTQSVFHNFGTVRKTVAVGMNHVEISAFNNHGVLDFQTGSANFATPFHNSGTLETQGGLIFLNSGGTGTGDFVANNAGRVIFNGDTYLLTNAELLGAGGCQLNNGTLTIAGDVTAGFLGMSSGTLLNGPGTLTITNNFIWGGGILGGTGSIMVAEGAALGMDSSVHPVELAGRSLILDGTGVWSGIVPFYLSAGTFTILEGGVWDILADASIIDADGSDSRIDNFGLIRKSSSTNRTGIGISDFTTAGTLEIHSGILSVTNQLNFGTNSTLHFSLGGTNAGIGYGRLELGSPAALQGTLQITTNRFTPTTNDLFTLLTFPSYNGTFEQQIAPFNEFTVIFDPSMVQFHTGITGGGTTLLVSMDSPTNGASYFAPATIALSATARDLDGTVTQVEFLDGNGQQLGVITNAPYQLTLTNLPGGFYMFMARAMNDDGETADSLPVTVSVAAQCATVPSGLVGWWQAESNANDVLGRHFGTEKNGASYVEYGQVGHAFHFDGVDDVVEVPDAPDLNFAPNAPMSVELWVYPAEATPIMHFIGKRSGCGSGSFNYQLGLNTQSGEGLAFGSGPGGAASGQNLPLHIWTHLAGTFDGSTFRLYINGALAASGAGTLGPTTTTPLRLGGSGDCSLFYGLMDEVAIYNRALSPAEIATIYYAGNAGKCPDALQLASAQFLSLPGRQVGGGITLLNGAAYIVGTDFRATGAEAIIARLNPTESGGTTLAWMTNWSGIFGGDRFYGIAASGSDVYAAGDSLARTLDTQGAKDAKGALVKFAAAGPFDTGISGSIWERQVPLSGAFNYGGGERLHAAATANEGGPVYIYTTGTGQNRLNGSAFFLSKVKSDSTVQWTVAEAGATGFSSGRALAIWQGAVYVAGEISVDGAARAMVRKYDSAGNLLWSTAALPGRFNGMTVYGGALYTVGQTATNAAEADFLMAKWDATGRLLWSTTHDEGGEEDTLNGLVGLGGRLYAVGSSSTDSNQRYVLLELNPRNGELSLLDDYDGPGDDSGSGIATDGTDLFVVGQARDHEALDDDMVVLRYRVLEPFTPLQILTTNLTYGELGQPYTASLQASGGIPPYTWSVLSNTLPNGLTLSSNGLIFGTPTQIGLHNFSLQAVDASVPAQQTQRSFALEIVAENFPPTVSLISPANGATFTAPASFTLTAEAEDNGGSITQVAFYQDGVFLGLAAPSPISVLGSEKIPTSSGLKPTYTLAITNLASGSYEFTAVATDNLGTSTESKPIFVRVNEANATVIDFEALDASQGDVAGGALSNYLAGFGLTITGETPGTSVAVMNEKAIGSGDFVRATSGDNVISQTGQGGSVAYTVVFSNSVATFGFTRVPLLAGTFGVSHPQWRATAYDSGGRELGSVGEDQITSYENVASQFFQLHGPDIASVRIDADDFYFTDFHSPVLDDFVFTAGVDNQPPAVAISQPTNNATFTAPAQVTVTAVASDPDGAVTEIKFYVGTYLWTTVATSNSASATLSSLAPGTYVVRAVAVDNVGAVRSSDPVTFTVNSAPGITILNFDALDARERNIGGLSLSNYLATHGVTLSGVTRGGRMEAADANNLFGGRAVTAVSPRNLFSLFGVDGPVTFTLNFAAPRQSVRFTRPLLRADGATATHPWWTARAYDANGVELASVGETLIQSSADVPAKEFNLSAPNIAAVRFDSHDRDVAAFSAVLLDDLILNTNAVVNPLSVQITSPASGFSVPGPTNLTLTASATNLAGPVAFVEFYAGPVFLGAVSNAPYSLVWSNVLPGSYTLRARVVDGNDAARISLPVNLTVTPGGAGNFQGISFEHPTLNTAGGSVTGAAVSNYLRAFGLTLTNVTAGTQMAVQNQENIYQGKAVVASSYSNIFTQIGVGSKVGFTFLSSNVLASFNFTRPKLVAGDNGITHPAWKATAYNFFGVKLAEVQEDFISSYFDVSSREFTLTGQGIASIRFESDNQQYAAFPAVLLDNLVLTASTSNLPPVAQITGPVADSLYLAPANVTLTARAVDPDGVVARVNFYYRPQGGVAAFLGFATGGAGEFSRPWANVPVGRYTVWAEAVDDDGATGLSEGVRLRVQPNPEVFGVVDQPDDLEIAVGGTAVFAVSTTEGFPVSFQWSATDFSTFTNTIPGATNRVLILTNVSTANIASYFVTATSGGATVTSEAAALNVVAAPVILTQPQGQTVGGGENVTFTVTASGAAPLRYQWLLNGSLIEGATTSALSLPNVQPTDSGNYRVLVQNSIGLARSEIASLVVSFGNGTSTSADHFAERISVNPLLGPTFGNNCSATLETGEPEHGGKRGGKSIWYTWRATFTGVMSFSTRGSSFDTLLAVYTGTSLTNLVLVASDDDSAGHLHGRVIFNCVANTDYQIAVDGFNGACGYVILSLPPGGYRVADPDSAEALPLITTQPVSQSVPAGATVTLAVTATSPTPLSYQWFHNNTPILAGTGSSFTMTDVQDDSVGRYFVQVVNDYGSADSAFADVQIVSTEGTNNNTVFGQDKFGDAPDTGVSASAWAEGKVPTGSAGTARTFNSTQIFNTVGNSKEEGEPTHCGETGGRSQWFTYVAATNGVLHINTTGSSFDTVLAVYTASTVDLFSLTSVACDRSVSGNGGDSVRFNAVKDTVYYIAVDGVGGAGGTVKLNITLGEAPAITAQPQSKQVAAGANAAFSVTATGSTNLTYQWQFNGANIAAATDSSFTRSSAQSNHVGAYRVVVSNSIHAATSSVVALTLISDCGFTISSNAAAFSPAGGSGAVAVTASSGCVWSVTNASEWITITSGSSGLGNGSVTYSVAPNGAAPSRSGTLTIAGKTFIVTQTGARLAGQTLTFNISAGSGAFAPAGSFLFVASPLTNAYRLLGLSGTTANSSGVYTYEQADEETGWLLTGTTNTTLTFTNATSGLYISTNLAGHQQTGDFRLHPTGPDFNADGRLDLVFQHTNGQSAAWFLQGTNFVQPSFLRGGQPVGSGWEMVGQADFNGDGFADLLWQHADQRLGVTLLNGTALMESLLLRDGEPASFGWRAVGTGDANDDQHPDIFFQHSDGRLAVWHMQGTNFVNAALLADGQAISAGWQAAGVTDFDGDGATDILFQSSGGRLAVWYMDGVTFLRSAYLRNGQGVAEGWQTKAVGDLNSDGYSDVLYQHSSGRLAVWFLRDNAYLGGVVLRSGQPLAAGWNLVGPQ